MQTPRKTGHVHIRCAPEDEAHIKKMVYEYLYLKDDTDKVIYQYLDDKSDLPLKTISWLLNKDHCIRVRVSTLEVMATNCGLPFTK